MTPHIGVTFVIPVHNGERWLEPVLRGVLAQGDGRPFEVIAVEDGSTDGSRAILARYAATGSIRVIDGPRRGAAAAINTGIREAAYPIICQVDQDVLLQRGWLRRLTRPFEDPTVAAAQGYYQTPRDGSIWARVMGLDLEDRYGRIRGDALDHVCTGNTAYRSDALRRVGLFDESLGYGYDNDMSYRLTAAGYRLVFCRDARSVHRWREDLRAYLLQQYGVGYGRIDVVAKHRRRVVGDDVSGFGMILHAPAMLSAAASFLIASVLGAAGAPWRLPAIAGAVVVGALSADRLVAGIRAAVRFGDHAGLAFVPAHLLRDVVWAFALVTWTARRLSGQASTPTASMKRGRVPGP